MIPKTKGDSFRPSVSQDDTTTNPTSAFNGNKSSAPSEQPRSSRERPASLNGLPRQASGRSRLHQATSAPLFSQSAASIDGAQSQTAHQLRAWVDTAPPQERAAREKVVKILTPTADQQAKFSTDDVDLSGLALTSLPDCLSKMNIKVLLLEGNSLKKLPSLPPGLTVLFAPDNELSDLPKLPAGLTVLNVRNNKLTQLPSLPPHSAGALEADLRGNPFSNKDLRAMHDSYKHPESGSTKRARVKFDAPLELPTATLEVWIDNAHSSERDARIAAARQIAEAYETNDALLNLSWLKLTSLPDCLKDLNIEELHLKGNTLEMLPPLPKGLTKLYAENNMLTKLPELPATLTSLEISNNVLLELPNLPQGMKDVDASNNMLEAIGELPDTLKELKIAGNLFSSLPTLPQSLIVLDIRNNQLNQIPALPNAAWSHDAEIYFQADLRGNPFPAGDLRSFQHRLDNQAMLQGVADIQIRIDTPPQVSVVPCSMALIKTRSDAKNLVKFWVDSGVPHENLVALRTDYDAYTLQSTLTHEVFNERYQVGDTNTMEPGKFFDKDSPIEDSSSRKNFAFLRNALPSE